MGNNDKIQEFNQFFSENYNYLKGFTKSIDPKNDYQSTLHTVYLKCRDRIAVNGYEGNNYMNFTRVSLMNTYKSQYRSNKKNTFVDIEDHDYYALIEEILLLKEEQDTQDELIQYELSYIVNGIYDYLDSYYSDKEKFIFKTYFLLKHKHLNYKQLSEATHYSISSVSNIIKKIKKDLRENLIIYLKTGIKMDELLEQVRLLLAKKGRNYNEYKVMYQKINGTKWNGCACKAQSLYNNIQEWYNKNKKT